MNAMSAEITEGEQARTWTKSGVTNLKALEKHYEAQSIFCRHTREDYEKAQPLFEEAITLDPKFVWPYVYLGYLHQSSAGRGWCESSAKCIQMAYDLAQKAISIDDTHDGPHALLASIYRKKAQEDKAIFHAERAVALNPNASDAYMQLSFTLGWLGKWEESVSAGEKSIRLSPFPGAAPFWALGRAYLMTGQYDESIATWKRALSVSPNFLPGYIYLAACYSSMGRDKEAENAAKEVLKRNPKFNIDSYAKRLSLAIKNDSDIERISDALRKAGLPEKST
jgi:adenylate cyclase